MSKVKKIEKKTFFKNIWNIIFLVLIAYMVVHSFTSKDDNNQTVADKIIKYFSDGNVGDSILEGLNSSIESVTEGCAKPKDSEVEAHYNDNAGSLPVAPDFDADPGEICGNGKKYFCTSKPPKKAIPFSWRPPPEPGTNPDYQGPKSGEPFKESPYAMPSPRVTKFRAPIRDLNDKNFENEIQKALEKKSDGNIAYVGDRELGE